jgi:hypothetical protein
VKLLLTGGGTGGHVYPALAIAEALRAEPALQPLEVLFVGTRAGLEARIVPATGVRTAFVRAAPLTRRLSPALFATLVQISSTSGPNRLFVKPGAALGSSKAIGAFESPRPRTSRIAAITGKVT